MKGQAERAYEGPNAKTSALMLAMLVTLYVDSSNSSPNRSSLDTSAS